MDDPTRRNPPSPEAPAGPPAVNAPIASLPGMPPIPAPLPGVSVHVQNIVAPAPMMMPAAPMMHPYAAPVPPAPAQVGGERSQGVLSLMKEDAAQRAMEAVSRRGPARVLALTVGAVMVATMPALLGLLTLGVPAVAVAAAEVPCLVIAVAAFVIARRVGQGPGGHQLEQAILRVAAQNGGVFRVVGLAQATGRPLKECQLAVDAMVASGHATVDADDRGGLVYRVPDLEPSRALEGGG